MKSIAIFGLVIFTTILMLGSTTNTVFAQENSNILLKIATRAQEQIQNQISDNSSEEIKRLFEESKIEFKALENSLSNDDMTSAKKHFLATMKIFTKISHQLTTNHVTQTETQTITATQNPSNDLLRMQGYVNNLKTIAKNHNATTDFSSIDNLFETAKKQISLSQFEKASQTIKEIKKTIIEINTALRQQASQHESNRAHVFALKYIKQLDRLIEYTQNSGLSEDIIQKLVDAREDLSLANSPSDVIKEVRNILLLQQKFELYESKLLDLRIVQIEKKIQVISNSDQVNQETLQQMNETLQSIKEKLSKNEYDAVNELLKSLSSTIEQNQI